jgi:hypothetical protein
MKSQLQRGMDVQHNAHAIQRIYVESHRVIVSAKHSPIDVGRHAYNPFDADRPKEIVVSTDGRV